jgi:hypothetical protein
MLTHQQLRTMALADAAVKAEFDKLSDEFSLLSEFLLARTSQGLNQTRGTVSKKFNKVCG